MCVKENFKSLREDDNDMGYLITLMSSDPALTGKLYQLRFYERRLSDAETMALLGVSSLSTVITEDLGPTS